MFPQKHKSTIFGLLIVRLHYLLVLAVFCVLTSLAFLGANSGQTAYAATSSTLNFQGRLFNSNGSVVPDGYYNIQFKLYDGGTDGGPGGTGQANAGTNLWTESYYDSNGVTAGNDFRLRVVNGYFSANLGSQTAFGAINWDQELWLTMNVGGSTQTATPTYDGEMLAAGNARTKLTAVPYAFRAGAITDGAGNAYDADDLVQLAPSSVQGVNSANTAIRVNQTGAGNLLQLQSSGSDRLVIENDGDLVAAGDGTFQGGDLIVGTASVAGDLTLYDGSSNTGILQVAALGQNSVFILPDPGGASDTICLQTLANCAGSGDIVQDGNSFGAAVTIGTNDDYGVNIETNGTTKFSLSNTGAALFQNGANSTTAFRIQNADASQTLFTADTTNNRIYIGNTAGDTTGTLLVLDTKTDAGDPTGVNGSMYYNDSLGKFRCYENGSWVDCLDGATTLQESYNNDADGSDTVIELSDEDDSLIIRNPSSNGTNGTAYVLTIDQLAVDGTGGLDIQSAGTGNLLRVRDTTATAQDVLTIVDGGATTFRNQTNSTTAFSIQDTAGSSLFNVDTTNSLVGTAITNTGSTNSQDFNLRTGNALGATSDSGSIRLDVGTATGTTGSILIGTVNNASAITIGSTTQTGIITVGQSTATNTINIGTVAGAGNTQTINIGTSNTATSATNVTVGSLIGTSTTNIQSGSGNINLQVASTATTGTVQIGAGGAGSATPDLLGLDVKSTAGDPSGANGNMYYNDSMGKFRCYEAGAWKDCDTNTAGTVDLQTAYDNGAAGDQVIELDATNDSLIFRNPSVGGSDGTGYVVTIDQLSTGTMGGLDIQSAGTGNLLRVRDTTATAQDVLTIADGGATTFRNQTDSASAFRIQAADGTTLANFDTSTLGLTLGSTTGTGTITIGQSTATNTINIGAAAGAGNTQTINIGTSNTATSTTNITVGSTIGSSSLTLQSGSGNINLNTPTVQFTESDSTRTLTAQTRTTNTTGTSITLKAGTAGTGGSAFSGGNLILQGGDAAGTGNANGGSITISGGAGVGTGVQGLVNLSTTAFSSASTQSFAVSGSLTAGLVDQYSTIPVEATDVGLTITVPVPNATNQIVGRVLYLTAIDGSEDFTISLGGSLIEIAMKANSTATLIWNGVGWTAAGASSSTDLQSAYNNTLTSAGGAELVLNPSGGNADGLTIRNNGTVPILGSLFEVQTSVGSNLFSVNNNATEYADNGGAESATFTMWTGTPDGGTVSRYTTVGNYVATGQASVSVVTAATANQGAENTLSTALTSNLEYSVSLAIRSTANFSTLDVVYSPDGTNVGTVACATGNTVTEGKWTRINCTFTAPASGITASNAIFIRQSDATARTFYVDNLSLNVGAAANHAADGSVDVALGTNWTAFGTLDALTRDTATIYDTSGSVAVDTPNATDRGVRNNLDISPALNTQYLVTFYARSSNTFNDIRVRYTPDGGSTFVSCVDYNTRSISTSAFTRVTCLFTTGATAVTDADLVIDQPTASDRIFYVDALSITLNTNTASNVQIGGGNLGGPTTLFTLDRSAAPPIASNNDAYLGSMYYDTTTGRIQCYESDGWGACGAAPDNYVNLNPEYAGAVLNGTGVGTMTADLCANESGVLTVNSTLCTSGESRNYYRWTSPQATQQTYSIYVSYQLPDTFNGFASDDTVQLVARADSTTNAAVTYEMFKSTGSTVTKCGTGETTVVTTANTWQSVGINGNEATGCALTSSSAGDFIIFKINVKANSNANAYVSTLSFTTTGR